MGNGVPPTSLELHRQHPVLVDGRVGVAPATRGITRETSRIAPAPSITVQVSTWPAQRTVPGTTGFVDITFSPQAMRTDQSAAGVLAGASCVCAAVSVMSLSAAATSWVLPAVTVAGNGTVTVAWIW